MLLMNLAKRAILFNTNSITKTIQSQLLRMFGAHSKLEITVACSKTGLFGREERRFLYFNHLLKEFLEQMIPHLKALI